MHSILQGHITNVGLSLVDSEGHALAGDESVSGLSSENLEVTPGALTF